MIGGPGSPACGRLRHPMIEEEGPGSPASGRLRHPMIEEEGPGSPASGRLRHPLVEEFKEGLLDDGGAGAERGVVGGLLAGEFDGDLRDVGVLDV
jgi:hypothetical protein